MNKNEKLKLIGIATLLLAGIVSFFIFRDTGKTERKGTDGRQADQPLDSASPENADATHQNPDDQYMGGPVQDFAARFQEIKDRANRGDAEAQLKLSLIYEKCAIHNLDPKKFSAQIDYWSKSNPRAATRLEEIERKYNRICSSVDDGQPIPFEAINLWRQQSADGGNTSAKLILAGNPLHPPKDKEVQDLFLDVMKEKNPEMAYYAALVSSRAESIYAGTELSPAFDGAYTFDAWVVAACRSGFNCRQDSDFMEVACLSTATCEYQSYEELVFDKNIPPAAKEAFNRQVDFITQHFLSQKPRK